MIKSKKSAAHCSCCGRNLSDPVSIALGIGPVCRISIKMTEMIEKTGNLFANRSEFSYSFFSGVLCIADDGGIKSLTNDIENALQDIITETGKPLPSKIIYRDSMGVWDGVKVLNGVVSFFSINETDKFSAIKKILP